MGNRTIGALCLGLALVATSAGCDSGAPTEPAVSPTAQAEQGPVAEGGTLVFGQTSGVAQLDPNTIASAAQTQLQTLLWNGLTTWAPDNTAQPDLAESWQHSPDFTSWTFNLRSGVQYHNGKPFTAAEAKKNFERVLDPEVPAQVATKIDMVSRVTAENDTTLVLELERPNPQLPAAIVDVKMSDVDDIANVDRNGNGTGPYELRAFVPDQTVELVRNEDYWGERPHLDEVTIVRYADATAAQTAMRSGEVDVLAAVAPDSAAGLATEGRQLLTAEEPASYVVWELDTTSPPFDNPVARQALSYAADRESMMDAGYAGYGIATPANVVVNPNNEHYEQGLPAHQFDLDKAKELFAEAGVTEGSTLTFWTKSGSDPEWTTIGEILQQDLAKIGITLDIQTAETSTWSAKFYPQGKRYPGTLAANYLSFTPLPGSYSLAWFADQGTCECNWSAPAEYNQAVATIESSAEGPELDTAITTAQRILNRESPIIVVGSTAFLSVAQQNVRGLWVQAEGTVHLEEAGFAA
ncbi:ABC transporter substrate-binding protein [Amycolatopsis cihanbeyliensis]|uniref:Peptide/nickel transport system substrate-binding protein n=1 Tax=Amycolatopsis cihanbeyliensis TaxID=1128664 RepID=A0A542DDU5_AMYCI|nr:ABC transporter substrate-binding protein [Amycolatopsis cihanbeyliensis]TQJ01241.1 peptide/nickel transport system substrate-binding protein [Amycolatopsis cihanbeyliensis]